ncbi:MAG: hypothetical protein WCJ58_02890 [bacterium]
MKAAIIGSKIDKKDFSQYIIIKQILEKNAVSVDFSYFQVSLDQDIENLEDVYHRNQELIKKTDILIAEVTDFSTGIGLLVGNALSQKKPVLALFNKNSKNVISVNLKSTAAHSKIFRYQEYSSEKELEKVLDKFVQTAKKLLDTKFILIISPEIDRYLEWAGETKRMHKAQLVRTALEEAMKKDKEYRKTTKKDIVAI